ncbi:MAG TPA: MATE family efflux transporter [Vicinamibacteria bacterium]|nr:MATE family efflux transporter [Vicinamibacteria bacterium]
MSAVDWWERTKATWRGPGGGREVAVLAYPLILGHLSFTVQTFVDRLFLTWYSPEAMAGAVTGLFAVWSVIALFTGTGEYLTTFVAQYLGAGRNERIGPALWQGLYFSLGAGLFVAALGPLAGPVFDLAGHAPALRRYEVEYARALLLGASPVILMATLSTFFAGRGRTHAVLRVNVLATVVNVVLDYLLIFGHAGFPEMGVTGAALGTILSQVAGALVYLVVILKPEYRRAFSTLAGWRPEPWLVVRLVRFGMPTGLQYSLELGAFAVFMVIVGRIGALELAASGIAFNLNMIVFMPMVGLAIAVSSLVGRYLGADRPEIAERAVGSALAMSLVYMTACGLLYVLGAPLLLAPYAAGADPTAWPGIAEVATVLLRFVAVYSIFDMINLVHAGGLRGAGDTVYPMTLTLVLAWGAMLVPAWVGCVLLGAGAYFAWTTASLYVLLLGLLMRRRFRAGRWKSMRVIEPVPLEP